MDGDKVKANTAGLNRNGRPKGTPNKLTRTVKEAFEVAFSELQGVPGAKLGDWAQANPTDFYKIAAKLIPSELNANVKGNLAGFLASIGGGEGEGNKVEG